MRIDKGNEKYNEITKLYSAEEFEDYLEAKNRSDFLNSIIDLPPFISYDVEKFVLEI